MTERLIAKEIHDNPKILNLELGAGCGNFGQKYYPKCFISDKFNPQELKATCSAHYVTLSFEAHTIPAPDNRFAKIIMCNPYGYGFKDDDEGTILFEELYRVLKKDGKIIILGTKYNSFSKGDKVKRCLKYFDKIKGKQTFTLNEKVINASIDYKEHTFRSSDGKEINPTYQIELLCHK